MNRKWQYRVVQALRESEQTYTPEDLQVMLGVSRDEAWEISIVLNEDLYGWASDLYRDPERAMGVCGDILETLHHSLDGWSMADMMVIERFLADLREGERARMRS